MFQPRPVVLDREVLVVAAIFATSAIEGFLNAEQGIANAAYVVYNALLSCAAVALALSWGCPRTTAGRERLRVRVALVLSVWLGHIAECLFLAFRAAPPPLIINQYVMVYAGLVVMSIVYQKSARFLLPKWLIMTLVEAHALSTWLLMRRLREPWVQVFLAHLAGVVAPALLLEHGCQGTKQGSQGIKPGSNAADHIVAGSMHHSASAHWESVRPPHKVPLPLEASPEFVSDLPSPHKPSKADRPDESKGDSLDEPHKAASPNKPPKADSSSNPTQEGDSNPTGAPDQASGDTDLHVGAAAARAESAGYAAPSIQHCCATAATTDPACSSIGARLVEPNQLAVRGAVRLTGSVQLSARYQAALGTAPVEDVLVRPGGRLASTAPPELSRRHMNQSQAIMYSIDRRRAQSWRGIRQHTTSVSSIKITGIELEQLPHDTPRLIHDWLSYCMPGYSMRDLAMRRGCVMMTLDLMSCGGADGAVDADGMRDLITRLMHDTSLVQGLEKGATMSVQTPEGLALCRWDGVTGTYQLVVNPTLDGLDPATLTSCGLMSARPAVYCLPDSTHVPRGATSHQLSLTVELQLPGNCQLHGWQPPGATAPPSAGGLLQDGPVLEAKLLVRQLGGGYLPVVVERMSSISSPTTNAATSAQVVVTFNGVAPAALRLELWCKMRATGNTHIGIVNPLEAGTELLVSDVPLLVLPGGCKEAASELLQHIEDMGGLVPRRALLAEAQKTSLDASPRPEDDPDGLTMPLMPEDEPDGHAAYALLDDLGLALTHRPRSIGTHATAAADGLVGSLGDDLLMYAVQRGLGAVAELMVYMEQHNEHWGPESKGLPQKAFEVADVPSTWLLRVAGCGTEARTSLLHAAVVSGKPAILQKVLRWGTLYGGQAWAWPWELEDATGCTALHLAAAQPASTCAGFLDTLYRTLPAAQLQAVRSAWLHCRARMGATPAELFGLVSDGSHAATPGWLWDNHAAAPSTRLGMDHNGVMSNGADPPNSVKSNGTDMPNSRCFRLQEAGNSGPSAVGVSSMPKAAANASPHLFSGGAKAQSWLVGIVEGWMKPGIKEYSSWTKKQISGLVLLWSVTMVVTSAVLLYRSIKAECKLHELPHLVLRNISYIPMMAATSNAPWLSDWQTWMLSVHMFQSMAYLAKVYLPKRMAFTWASNGADAIYAMVFMVVLDKMVEAYNHSHATSVKIPDPLVCALAVHGMAVAVSTVCQAQQLRAYCRWQATQESEQ